MHIQTASRLFIGSLGIGAVPAIRAGILVLLFLAAALVPLGVFVLLLVLYPVFEFWRGDLKKGGWDTVRADFLSNSALLSVVLAAGMLIDMVITDLLGGIVGGIAVIAFVIMPKLQLLKTIVLDAEGRLSSVVSMRILITSFALIVSLPFFTGYGITEILHQASEQLFSSRF